MQPGELETHSLLADTIALKIFLRHRERQHLGAFVCLVGILLPFARAQEKSKPPTSAAAAGVRQSFEGGEAALRSGDLAEAERDFRRVIANDPQSAGGYANLGVVYMRRKDFGQAVQMFRKAERLAPTVPGIRLNIGLAFYRQNRFREAIAPFASVLRDQPDLTQARYLLGLCYFFDQQWSDAVKTLQPLWGQQSLNLNYLYVLGIAAHKAGNKEVDERALSQLTKVGQDTPEFHLLMGKAYLNNGDNDKAILEFKAAASGDPKLPFVHYNLGLAYLNQQDYEHAAKEFESDIALEPDEAFNYDRVATVEVLQQQNEAAEKNFRKALQLDPMLVSSHVGLAKIYQTKRLYPQSLAELSAAEKLSPEDYTIHNLRGQVLQRMGERDKAKAEFEIYTKMMNTAREKRGRQLNGEIPDPQLTQELE